MTPSMKGGGRRRKAAQGQGQAFAKRKFKHCTFSKRGSNLNIKKYMSPQFFVDFLLLLRHAAASCSCRIKRYGDIWRGGGFFSQPGPRLAHSNLMQVYREWNDAKIKRRRRREKKRKIQIFICPPLFNTLHGHIKMTCALNMSEASRK